MFLDYQQCDQWSKYKGRWPCYCPWKRRCFHHGQDHWVSNGG